MRTVPLTSASRPCIKRGQRLMILRLASSRCRSRCSPKSSPSRRHIRRCVLFRVSFFVAKFGMFTHNLFSFQYYMLCLKRLMARYPFCCCKHTLLWSYNQNICSYLIFCFVLFSIIQNICRVNELCMDYKHFGCSLFII